jgi:predicted nucleotidyltransferase
VASLDDKIKQRALDAIRVLNQLARVRAAYVFGSHVEGNADKWSDIDIAAFMEGIESWDIRRRARAMGVVQKEAGLDIEAHLFPESVLDHPPQAGFVE